MKPQSSLESGLQMSIPIRFVKDYQKPANAGGKIIKKDRECWVTQEFATEMITAGYAVIVETSERKLLTTDTAIVEKDKTDEDE